MERLSALDARFLHTETPGAHMHTMKAVVVDVSGRPDRLTPERFIDQLEVRLPRLPVLRRRIVEIPYGLTDPVVIDDPDFDLARHLHHRHADPTRGRRALADVVAEIAATPLPRDRPLWDLTVVEGLPGDEIAFVAKIHHALADGLAAVALLENAFVLDDADAVIEPYDPEPVPDRIALYRAATRTARERIEGLPGVVRDHATGLRRRRDALRGETTPVLGPFAGPRTPFNVALVPERTVATLALPLPPLLDARRRVGASLNDVFLTLCAGGVRRYLQRRGELPTRPLVASVPMATAAPRPRLGGNHVDNLFLSLHTDVADTWSRVVAIHSSTVAARRVRAALGPELLEARAGLVMPLALALTTRGWAATHLAGRVRPPLNLVASNVPGPRTPLELEGGVVTALWSCGPVLEGIGLNLTAWSYVDTLYLTLLGCPRSLPDPWQLADDIERELRELERGP